MDLRIENQWFVVCGAGSGFGRSIAEQLIQEGAKVIAIARTKSVLDDFSRVAKDNLVTLCGDITQVDTQLRLMEICSTHTISGIVINAGGPPAKSFLETDIDDWDGGWHSLVRCKLMITMRFLPLFRKQQYGRLLFIESVSVKQRVENLALSNSLRLAVVGFAKTLSGEVAKENITVNVMAPGYHNTAAMQRLFQKMSSSQGITLSEAKDHFEKLIPVGRMGEAQEFAGLAAWLLSPLAAYVTGQTISHDGGSVMGTFG